MRPFLSVVMAARNVAPYAGEAVASLLAQSDGDWNLVCVDDGSTDGTARVVAESAAGDPRLRVVSGPALGVSAARNAALELADGEWVAFLDGDDVVAPDFVADLRARSAHADAVFRRMAPFADGSAPRFEPERREDERLDLARGIDLDRVGMRELAAGMQAWRRAAIEGVRFRPFICGEDRLFALDALLRAGTLVVSDASRYGYRKRKGSYSGRGIATEEGWLGELDYRLELAKTAQLAPRRVSPGDARWITVFACLGFPRGAMRFPLPARIRLLREWYRRIGAMKRLDWFRPRERRFLSVIRPFA